jgi:hypothetical protein
VKVLLYLLVPVLVVTAAATWSWLRNRQPTSLQSGVDSFRREMDALSPDAAPGHGRQRETGAVSRTQRPAPRRPPSSDQQA